MRSKILPFISGALLAVLIMIPVYYASARNTASVANVAAQDAQLCQDEEFLALVTEDFTKLSSDVEKYDTQKPVETLAIMYVISQLRHKYEDLENVPQECEVTRRALIFLLANRQDAYLPVMGAVIDEANKDEYEDALKEQQERVDAYVKIFQALIGAETEK